MDDFLMTKNIIPHQHLINREDRSAIKGHTPALLWFTGLSGSGKSTIANAVEYRLNHEYRAHTYLLDGDNIRSGLNKDLIFVPNSLFLAGTCCKLGLE